MPNPLTRLAARVGAPTPDSDLITRFVRDRDEAAFAVLVHRHGPTVFGVCRRLLGQSADADDAFQAVFLVLANRADTLVGRATIGGWLHGVAVRVALQARVTLARRRKHERVAASRRPESAPDPAPTESCWIDREMSALPDKFREPVVLCLLQDRPRADVAAELGIPEGTLASRLDTARRRLADRLARYRVPLVLTGLLVPVPAAVAEGAVGRATDGPGLAIHQLASEVSNAMTTNAIRPVLISAGILAAAVGGLLLAASPEDKAARPAGPPPEQRRGPAEDEPTEWFRQHAHPVYVEAKNDDDLAAVVRAIGKSRVVVLGELTHGDGTGFVFKSRLIRHLHEHAGFDVLVWESGLMDCEDLDAGFAGTKPLDEVAGMGLFAHWSHSAETQPLFEYVRKSHATRKPLRQAGFDIQLSGSSGNSRYPNILAWIGEPGAAPEELVKKFGDAVQEVRQVWKQPDTPAADRAKAMAKIRALTAQAAGEYAKRSEALTKTLGAETYGVRMQCLKAAAQEGEFMALYERQQESKKGADFIAAYNFRERHNAEHLIWLAKERYKDKKLIVWTHNVHLFAGLPDAGDTSLKGPTEEQLDSTGRLVKDALKDDMYGLGFVAGGGTWSWLSNPVIEYKPPPEGGIEEKLLGLKKGSLFVDLRPARDVPALMKPLKGVVNQQDPRVLDTCWPRAFDGIIYLNEVKPRQAVTGRK